jgi:hypothetical protein
MNTCCHDLPLKMLPLIAAEALCFSIKATPCDAAIDLLLVIGWRPARVVRGLIV